MNPIEVKRPKDSNLKVSHNEQIRGYYIEHATIEFFMLKLSMNVTHEESMIPYDFHSELLTWHCMVSFHALYSSLICRFHILLHVN